jgi:hypothetical protein
MEAVRWLIPLTLLVLVSCGGGDSDDRSPALVQFIEQSTDTSLPGETRPVRILISDSQARPLGGVGVALSNMFGTGNVSPTVAVTDGAGIATATWQLGAEAGVSQKLEARVGALAAVLGVNVSPLAFHASGLSISAQQSSPPCVSNNLDVPIPAPACSQELSELKIQMRGRHVVLGMSQAAATLVCGNIEVPLEWLLAQGSAEPESLVTVTWSASEGGPASVSSGPTTSVDVVVRPDVVPGVVRTVASACDVSRPSFAAVTIEELSLWTNYANKASQ